MIKLNNFRGDLTDISAKTEALVNTTIHTKIFCACCRILGVRITSVLHAFQFVYSTFVGTSNNPTGRSRSGEPSSTSNLLLALRSDAEPITCSGIKTNGVHISVTVLMDSSSIHDRVQQSQYYDTDVSIDRTQLYIDRGAENHKTFS